MKKTKLNVVYTDEINGLIDDLFLIFEFVKNCGNFFGGLAN